MSKSSILNFLNSLLLVAITALWCAFFNNVGMENFYNYIKLPSITPPNYVFPIVWIILYSLMAISYDLILNLNENIETKTASQLFVINLVLQIIWSFTFFFAAYFLIGFIILILLDFIVIAMIKTFYNLNKTAAFLLFPYFLWLLFATYLNWSITDLNGAVYLF